MNKDKVFPPVYYSDYLELDKILNSQHPKSDEYNDPAHDEMLFIIMHQVVELWFKQTLFELDDVIRIFDSEKIDEKKLGIVTHRLQRVVEIQKLLVEQIRVIETMTPLDFLDFRDYLIPASGFQSYQFRLLENRLGLEHEKRLKYNNVDYNKTLSSEHQKLLETDKPSLFQLLNNWLERTPFIKPENFDFWNKYKDAVEQMLDNDERIIKNNNSLSEEKKKKQLEMFSSTRENLMSLFDESKHLEKIKDGTARLSLKATLAALFINLYRDEPILYLPFQVLNNIIEMDELFATWRYRHSIMVHRLIGIKVGTGGSSGHNYLLQTVEKHRVFKDLFNISTYMIPRSQLPSLSEEIKSKMDFYYTQTSK